jgi:hypothetical protein
MYMKLLTHKHVLLSRSTRKDTLAWVSFFILVQRFSQGEKKSGSKFTPGVLPFLYSFQSLKIGRQ